ncbi:MAG TPA: hypothetical protein VJT75_17635, partial [Thermoleophilaceae bacterium]|nr:hypothetical protein [Thermoleophilaceae bacterium]
VPPPVPLGVARGFAALGELVARVAGIPPQGSSGQVHFFAWDAWPDSSKAQDELGWEPTPIEEGVRVAVKALRD